MSPYISLQQPYLIASLPQQISSPSGNYVVSEVYGGAPGLKKRKRSELAVGIDGEGISASRLITSYALPPQSFFTCSPRSLRTRISKSKVVRKTYVSVINLKPQITLFYDSKEGTGETSCSEASQDITGSSSRVVFVGTIKATGNVDISVDKTDVLLVKEDCEIQCYDGENLQEKWTSPAFALFRESQSRPTDAKVEFVHITNAYSARQGILKSRHDVFAIFSQEITKDGFNPEIIVIITKSEKQASRSLHIVSLPRILAQTAGWKNQRCVDILLVSKIPYAVEASGSQDDATISVHASAGTLQHLENGVLAIYDLVSSLPRVQYKVKSPGAQSFLRISDTLIIISAGNTVSVYNPKFQSRLSTVGLDSMSLESLKRKRGSNGKISHLCKLVAYLPKLAVAVAIMGNNLIGIQLEGQQDRYGKRRASGLLIESLGCSISEEIRPSLDQRQTTKRARNEFKTLKPVKRVKTTTQQLDKILEPIEKSISTGDCTAEVFDSFMAPYLAPDGTDITSEKTYNELLTSCLTDTSTTFVRSLEIDKRWAIYALGKMFAFFRSEDRETRLSVSFYARNTFMWLIHYGYMTTTNIEHGLRSQSGSEISIPAGELTRTMVELDPEMKLLFILIKKTHLGAAELLQVIRRLTESLDLWGNNPGIKKELVNYSLNDHDSVAPEGNPKLESEQMEADPDAGTDLVKHQLGPSSGIRGEALSLALSKLYSCPDETIVYALQTTYSPQSIVCLIYLLRFELARGGWTARYLDSEVMNTVNEGASKSENIILLISTLLNCCIDAIGAGGWLSGEARLVDGNPYEAEELISSLKIEISAALEGIEETVYLQKILAEMVRYGDLIQKQMSATKTKDTLKPITLSTEQSNACLPLGLKAEKQISLLKMRAGGEVTRRTMRDIGDLKSRMVEKYSRERINV